LSISGIPPLNGFVSKWMVYQGILETGQNGAGVWVLWLAAAMLGSALTMASFVKVLHAGFLCKPSRELAVRPPREVGVSMALPMVVLAAICVLFGVLAYRLPLRQLILPVMDAMGQPVAYPGVWWGGAATVMLLVAFAVGLLIYFLTTARTVRGCETYIGGEDLNEAARRTGAPAAAAEGEVTGADFYRTIEELPILGGFYRAADRKLFDVYEVGKQATSVISRALQVFHTGVLRSYVTWYVVGLLILLWALR
jgi:NADH:ubiquinone oxidoreductase subunit 5 (subunit L)/multisubunit Na+/H+ antiporter MnhA subunit